MLVPKRLAKGDTLGIVSPSTPVTPDQLTPFQKGKAFLENFGFKVLVGEHVFSTTWGYAASPGEKAADVNRMFADEQVRAIICSQGGATANACLPYLDWDLIRQNPKIFLGISDITVLLNAIHRCTGLVTFHGNDLLWGFGGDLEPYDVEEFKACLVDARVGAVPSNGPRRVIRGGKGQGKLLGGNLHCLLKLAGTPYFPDFSGSILFVEAIGITPEACDHLFHQLKQMGVFEQIKGVLVGFNDGLQNNPDARMQMEEVLARITSKYDFPILKVDDFGHNCPNTTLPVGAQVLIDADACQYEILTPPVE